MREDRDYHEPMIGGGHIISEVIDVPGSSRYGYDGSEALITMYRAIQQGWDPPDFISREEYDKIRDKKDPKDPITAYAGYAWSSMARYFSGYFDIKNQDKNKSSKNSATRYREQMQTVILAHADYRTISPAHRSIIYCDPPYAGTTGYGGCTFGFDHADFFIKCREWAENGHIVLISEYTMPDDFLLIEEWADKKSTACLHGSLINKKEYPPERLYRMG